MRKRFQSSPSIVDVTNMIKMTFLNKNKQTLIHYYIQMNFLTIFIFYYRTHEWVSI